MVSMNDRIGNYRVIAQINSGSYGSVYMGKHILLLLYNTMGLKHYTRF